MSGVARVTHAFGLQVECEEPLPGLLEGSPRPERATTTLTRTDRDSIESAWEGAVAERVRESRYADGSLMMAIDHDPGRGYRIEAPGHGDWLVGTDGATILAAFSSDPAWRWQLVLFAQVLPLAATLRGIELLHASAVAIGGRAFAVAAPSGTGKSSVAMHLIAQGARFFADDAVAVEVAASEATAHPGGVLVRAHEHELATLGGEQLARLGPTTTTGEKVHLEPPATDDPLPLAGLFFLERGGREPLAVDDGVEPTAFLANTFVQHVRTPERMAHQLGVCAQLAQAVPTERVRAPADAQAPDVARFLFDRMERAA